VSYKGNVCLVTNQLQQQIQAKRVIVSVPVSILKDKDITFEPALPPAKLDAINRIGFGPALKVRLAKNPVALL